MNEHGNYSRTSSTDSKMEVRGKFLYLGKEKFYVKGVTYGTLSGNCIPFSSGQKVP